MERAMPGVIPRRTEYYNNFLSGDKTDELRAYGPRWNEKTCAVGRTVILSKGYGNHSRMSGVIWKFKKQHGTLFGSEYKESILNVYGTLDINIACISINNIRQIESEQVTNA